MSFLGTPYERPKRRRESVVRRVAAGIASLYSSPATFVSAVTPSALRELWQMPAVEGHEQSQPNGGVPRVRTGADAFDGATPSSSKRRDVNSYECQGETLRCVDQDTAVVKDDLRPTSQTDRSPSVLQQLGAVVDRYIGDQAAGDDATKQTDRSSRFSSLSEMQGKQRLVTAQTVPRLPTFNGPHSTSKTAWSTTAGNLSQTNLYKAAHLTNHTSFSAGATSQPAFSSVHLAASFERKRLLEDSSQSSSAAKRSRMADKSGSSSFLFGDLSSGSSLHLGALSSDTQRILKQLERMPSYAREARSIPLRDVSPSDRTDGRTTSTAQNVTSGAPSFNRRPVVPQTVQVLPRLAVLGTSLTRRGTGGDIDGEGKSDGGGKIRVVSRNTGTSKSTARTPAAVLPTPADLVAAEHAGSSFQFSFTEPRAFVEPKGLRTLVVGSPQQPFVLPAFSSSSSTATPALPKSSSIADQACSLAAAVSKPDARDSHTSSGVEKQPVQNSVPTTPANTTASFSDFIGGKKWQCMQCHFKNRDLEVECVQCGRGKGQTNALRDEIVVPTAPAKTETGMTPKWTCAECWVENNSGNDECACCRTAKPARQSAPPTDVPKASAKWTCGTCLVPNDANATSCICCATQKTSASVGNKPDSSKPVSKWTCPTCMVVNGSDVLKCPCCETAKPGSAPMPVLLSGVAQAAAKLPPGVSFGFGAPTTKVDTTRPLSQAPEAAEGDLQLPPKTVRFAEPLVAVSTISSVTPLFGFGASVSTPAVSASVTPVASAVVPPVSKLDSNPTLNGRIEKQPPILPLPSFVPPTTSAQSAPAFIFGSNPPSFTYAEKQLVSVVDNRKPVNSVPTSTIGSSDSVALNGRGLFHVGPPAAVSVGAPAVSFSQTSKNADAVLGTPDAVMSSPHPQQPSIVTTTASLFNPFTSQAPVQPSIVGTFATKPSNALFGGGDNANTTSITATLRPNNPAQLFMTTTAASTNTTAPPSFNIGGGVFANAFQTPELTGFPTSKPSSANAKAAVGLGKNLSFPNMSMFPSNTTTAAPFIFGASSAATVVSSTAVTSVSTGGFTFGAGTGLAASTAAPFSFGGNPVVVSTQQAPLFSVGNSVQTIPVANVFGSGAPSLPAPSFTFGAAVPAGQAAGSGVFQFNAPPVANPLVAAPANNIASQSATASRRTLMAKRKVGRRP